jgi:hypothetical protein
VRTFIVVVRVRPPRVRLVMVKLTSRARVAGQGLVAGRAAAPAQHQLRLAEKDQFRAVGQRPEHGDGQAFLAVLDPPGQAGAARGEPQPPVHGEEPPVGQVDDPWRERGFQFVGQGVLGVAEPADRGGDPPAGAGPHVRDQLDKRPGPAAG